MTSSEPDVALLAEDDEPVRSLTARMLALHGFNVLQAENGQEALTHLSDGIPIALVVTDLMMPVMDGYQLLETMRRDRPLPAVAITATLALSEVQEKRLGGAPLLYKPFTLESFLEAIRAARFERPDFSYQIDGDNGIVSMRTAEAPTVEEKIAIVHRIWADPQYRRGFAIIIDRRGFDDVPTMENARMFIRFVRERESRVTKPSRWAIVADRPSAWHFYQSLEPHAAQGGIQLRAFQDYDIARQWAICGD
jgi:CheY-like chemotaxis protein